MGGIYLKLRRRRDTLANIDDSKFLGDPVIPAELDADSVLGDDEVFICQLDCAQMKPLDRHDLLPREGWLWFFVDLEEYPYSPRVVYSKWGPEFVLEEYNEEWVEDTTRAWGVTFSDKEKDDGGAVILPRVTEDDVTLLSIDPEKTQLGLLAGAGGTVSFVLKRDELTAQDFANVRLAVE